MPDQVRQDSVCEGIPGQDGNDGFEQVLYFGHLGHGLNLLDEGGKLVDAVLYVLEVGHDLVVWIMLLIFCCANCYNSNSLINVEFRMCFL